MSRFLSSVLSNFQRSPQRPALLHVCISTYFFRASLSTESTHLQPSHFLHSGRGIRFKPYSYRREAKACAASQQNIYTSQPTSYGSGRRTSDRMLYRTQDSATGVRRCIRHYTGRGHHKYAEQDDGQDAAQNTGTPQWPGRCAGVGNGTT